MELSPEQYAQINTKQCHMHLAEIIYNNYIRVTIENWNIPSVQTYMCVLRPVAPTSVKFNLRLNPDLPLG